MPKNLQIIHRCCPGLLACQLACQLLGAVQPFITLTLSGLLTSALLAGAFDAALRWGLACVGATFVLAAAGAGLQALCARWRPLLDLRARALLAGAVMRQPYDRFIQPQMRDDLKRLNTERSTVFASFPDLLDSYAAVTRQLLSLATAAVLLARLFAARSAPGAPLAAVADSPLTLLGLLAGSAAVLYGIHRLLVGIGDAFYRNLEGLYKLDRTLRYYDQEYLNVSAAGKDVRLFRQKPLIDASAQQAMDATCRVAKNMSLAQGGGSGLVAILALCLKLLFSLYAVLKIQTGALPLGMLVTYLGAARTLSTGIQRLSIALVDLQKTKGYFALWHRLATEPTNARVADISAAKTSAVTVVSDTTAEATGIVKAAPTVTFEHVSYRYPNTDRDALHDVSFTLAAGARTALVGQNGSGKSTAVALLCRLLTPSAGRILIDGRDLATLSEAESRRLLSAVLQDFWLPAFTLGENVAAAPTYDRARVAAALARVGLRSRSLTAPEVVLYKEFDADGVEPSGGEAQKIALARALYKDAPLLLLDEPTAALDPLAEEEIYRHMAQLAAGKTALFISHRLSSCRDCDNILVLDAGTLLEQGTHAGLLAAGGKYARLWQLQAQYYARQSAQ